MRYISLTRPTNFEEIVAQDANNYEEAMVRYQQLFEVFDAVANLTTDTSFKLRLCIEHGYDVETGEHFHDLSVPVTVKFRDSRGILYAGDGRIALNISSMLLYTLELQREVTKLVEQRRRSEAPVEAEIVEE